MNAPRIYLYWEDAGSPRNWYYSLCLETVLRYNPGATVVSRDMFVSEFGPIPSEMDDIYIIHRVDWIRKLWIHRFGGLWLDMDFICFKPLDALARLSRDFDFIGYREWPGNWMDNFFAARPGSMVLASAAEYAREQCRQKGKSVTWFSTNADSIDYSLKKHPWAANLQLPTHLVSPVSVMEPEWFCSSMTPTDDMSGFNSYGFITSYHGLHGWLASQSRDQFLTGPSKLASIFKRALG